MPLPPLFDLRADPSPIERGRQLSCVSCGLYKDVLNPKMAPHGANRRRIMVIGEGPGETEDTKGKPWQGRAGSVLRNALTDSGINLDNDCISLNSVACRPPKNREPTPHEIACCRVKTVNPAVDKYAPKVILLMGGSAVSSVLGPLHSDALGSSIGKWRGFTIPISEWGAWVCPTYHPSYVMRDEKRIEIDTVWKKDIRRALDLIDVSIPSPEDLRSKIVLLHSEVEILRAIYAAHKAEFLSYDYETTGLRASLHKIICVSFAYSSDCAYSFMMPETGPILGAWSKLMVNSSVGKISHNMKFENDWTLQHFKDVDSINWAWDSMIAAHVCDNRVGICGLKLQAFLMFGISSWDDKISPYLKAVDDKDLSSSNRIYEYIGQYGEDECLIYCGIDSLLAFRLAMKQMREIRGNA